MPSGDPVGELTEVIEAIDRIAAYVSGLDEVSFCASDKDVDAAAMNLIVIGEAVRRLPDAVLTLEPAVPWPAIVAMRNRIAHGYSSVQRPIVWAIITEELPRLRAATVRMIDRLEDRS